MRYIMFNYSQPYFQIDFKEIMIKLFQALIILCAKQNNVLIKSCPLMYHYCSYNGDLTLFTLFKELHEKTIGTIVTKRSAYIIRKFNTKNIIAGNALLIHVLTIV